VSKEREVKKKYVYGKETRERKGEEKEEKEIERKRNGKKDMKRMNQVKINKV
jgi:hypothetical protein